MFEVSRRKFLSGVAAVAGQGMAPAPITAMLPSPASILPSSAAAIAHPATWPHFLLEVSGFLFSYIHHANDAVKWTVQDDGKISLITDGIDRLSDAERAICFENILAEYKHQGRFLLYMLKIHDPVRALNVIKENPEEYDTEGFDEAIDLLSKPGVVHTMLESWTQETARALALCTRGTHQGLSLSDLAFRVDAAGEVATEIKSRLSLARHISADDLRFFAEMEFYEAHNFMANILPMTSEYRRVLNVFNDHPLTAYQRAYFYHERGLSVFNRVCDELVPTSIKEFRREAFDFYDTAFDQGMWSSENMVFDFEYFEKTKGLSPKAFAEKFKKYIEEAYEHASKERVPYLRFEPLGLAAGDVITCETVMDSGFIALYRITNPQDLTFWTDADRGLKHKALQAAFGDSVKIINHQHDFIDIGLGWACPDRVLKKIDSRAVPAKSIS